MLTALILTNAYAQSNLDDLVALAVAQDPEVRALGYDADAASARAVAVRRPMDPQLMVQLDAIGVGMDAPDPSMGMLGATQMLRGFGEGRAEARRIELDATRAGADELRVIADLRTTLWQSAARIQALEAEIRLLDDEVRAATAAGDVGLARYGAGAVIGGGGSGMSGMDGGTPSGASMGGAAAPLVQPRSVGGGGMAGMGGTGAVRVAVPQPGGMPMGSTGGSTATPPPAGGLPALLALQAEIARVQADRSALEAELDGEVAMVGVFVGDAAADAVRADPGAFLGATRAPNPERRLAEVDVASADAALASAVAARRPDVMIGADQRFMPTGMPAGTDVVVGLEVPLWGARGEAIDAARADLDAARARAERVDRDLAVARAKAKAAVTAARARAAALEGVAVPKAVAAWDTAVALFATGTVGEDQVLRAWQTRLAAERGLVDAKRDVQLREAELARVEGP